ncbi:hypothetical protein ES703_68416 [subsurface metagenome]
MMPDRLNFLKRFDNFCQVMINSAKENKINEKDFYMLIGSKCKTMDQERRSKLTKTRGDNE